VSASRGSFADYLLFMDQFVMPDGTSIWFTSTGNFDGRVHTNTSFKYDVQAHLPGSGHAGQQHRHVL
jgi:hypothetical protein